MAEAKTFDFVAVDMGASNTRYVSNKGKFELLPNNMVFLNESEKVTFEPYTDDVESALDVTITSKTTGKSQRILVGSMAARYSPTNVRPSVMDNKYKQEINLYSAILSAALSRQKFGIGRDIYLFLALPPIEVKSSKDEIKQTFFGEYSVKFNKFHDLTLDVNFLEVNPFEESAMAIVAYFFELNGGMREEAKKFAQGNVLSIDIGASTTDLAVVQNMKYIEQTGKTYKTGGNIARESIIDYIRGEYGFDAPDDVADMAIAEGRLQMGNTYVDCSEAVENAKSKLASSIVTQIQSYFRSINIPIQTVRAVVVSGGGSMAGEYTDEDGTTHITSRSVSEYITESLSTLCKGIEVEQFSNSPRMANITGLFIQASFYVMRLAKQAQAAANQG